MKTVLVIDDAKAMRVVAQKILEKAGYTVLHGEDGVDGLRMLNRNQPDLIVVDVEMPRMDGLKFCELVKQSEEFGCIPVVMLTSKTGQFDQAKARLAKADGYVCKPFDSQSLLNKLEEVFTGL